MAGRGDIGGAILVSKLFYLEACFSFFTVDRVRLNAPVSVSRSLDRRSRAEGSRPASSHDLLRQYVQQLRHH